MVIIFGRRSYGRVDAHGGEHAHTRFAHVYYVPIFPLSSFWVTQDLGGSVRGFEIRSSGKSIAAAYLRVWAPIAAIASLASGSLGGVIAAAILAVLSAWAWSWRNVRGDRAMRASDFRLLAFGTRCDPALMTRALRDDMKRALDARWAKLDTQRPPDEVAEHGANSSGEAVGAYGLLVLAALDAPDATARANAAAAAQRILDGAREDLAAEDGPYRAGAAATPAPVFDEIASVAGDVSAQKAGIAQRAAQHPTMRRRGWSPIFKIAVVALVAMTAMSLAIELVPTWSAPTVVSFTDVDGARDIRELVSLHCDSIERAGEFTDGTQVSACIMGDKLVPIVGKVDELDAPVVGRLRLVTRTGGSYIWPEDMLDSPRVSVRYLNVESLAAERALGLGGLVVLVALFGWLVRTIVRRVRRRAKQAE